MSYCCVIERELATSSCPLHRGACFWKHRLDGTCTYSESVGAKTIDDLAKLVGLEIPTPEQVVEIHGRLKNALITKRVKE